MVDIAQSDNQNQVAAAHHSGGGKTYRPRVDFVETDSELTLYAEMPGVSAEELDIQFDKGELTIHGRVDARHENAKSIYAEYGVGDFYRGFRVESDIDAEKISAELKSGVLQLHLPKACQAKRVQVRAL